jgi:hypothetical protein
LAVHNRAGFKALEPHFDRKKGLLRIEGQVESDLNGADLRKLQLQLLFKDFFGWVASLAQIPLTRLACGDPPSPRECGARAMLDRPPSPRSRGEGGPAVRLVDEGFLVKVLHFNT